MGLNYSHKRTCFHSMLITHDSPHLLCSAEGDPAVRCRCVLRRLHPHLRHHCKHCVSLPQGEFLLWSCAGFLLLTTFFMLTLLFLSWNNDSSAALCDHRSVRSGGDGGICDALPDPPAEEASSVVVDLPSGPQDQGVPSV